MDLISKEKPVFTCIQETMLSKQTNFYMKYYNGLFNGHIYCRAHVGVAIFIHETILHQKLTLKTPLRAISARVSKGRDVTIVPIYISRSHDITEKFLSTLVQQLPKPVVVEEDFNSYHQIWRNPVNDNRG